MTVSPLDEQCIDLGGGGSTFLLQQLCNLLSVYCDDDDLLAASLVFKMNRLAYYFLVTPWQAVKPEKLEALSDMTKQAFGVLQTLAQSKDPKHRRFRIEMVGGDMARFKAVE
jgi:hypothetical protein